MTVNHENALSMKEPQGHELVALETWEKAARSALQKTDTKGTNKLTRRRLANICNDLASQIPLETAARLHGTTPRQVQRWCETRPPIAAIIEQARAEGEKKCLTVIAGDKSWKAADALLQHMNSGYNQGELGNKSGGVNITINVPVPQQFAAGEQPVIDITPTESAE